MHGDIMIRNVGPSDATAIAAIYNHYINNTIVTFEEQEITPAEIDSRINSVISDSLPWLVAEEEGEVIGYAYATKWRERSAYRFAVESSVYLQEAYLGKGIGSTLYSELLSLLRKKDIHAVIGGIALPNPSSIALLEKFGFEQVAQFKEVGMKFDKWIDVGYWQLILNS